MPPPEGSGPTGPRGQPRWRDGLRVDRSAGEVLILDPQAHRLVRLAGPAALAPGRDDVRAHLAALGLVDATGEGAALLGASRREVLTAGAAAALGITVLALPGAASAASVDPAGNTVSGVDGEQIDLILARATTGTTGAGLGYLTGSRDRDAAVRTVNLGTGALGTTLENIGPAVPVGAGTYPRDIVRVGTRAYIVYVVTTLESHLSSVLDDFIPAYEHIVGSGVIEVALDADSPSGMEFVRGVSTDVLLRGPGDGEGGAPLRWAMLTCAATDGTDVFIAAVVDFGSAEEPQFAAGVIGLNIPSDVSEPLTTTGGGVSLSGDGAASAPPFEVPLAMVVADGALYVHVQLHPPLTARFGGEGVLPDDDVSLAAIFRVPLDELDPSHDEEPGGTVGFRLIGEGLNFPAISGGLHPQPQPIVFAGNLYVVDQVATRDDEGDGIIGFEQRISRFVLAGDWGSGPPDPVAGADPDQVLVLERHVVDGRLTEPSPDPASSLLRVGSTLLLGSLLAIRRVIIGDDGVMTLPDDAAARHIDLIPTFEQILDLESDPDPDGLVVIGVGPALPATNPLRAFFGLGKGKGVLIEVLV